MNNKFLSSLLCITVLALAPACKKNQPKASSSAKATADRTKEDIKTMIELDNAVFETEENNDDQQVVKF